jgi:tRNA pseudouridine-54 N-methylase
LLLETLIYLGWARILKAMPFARIVPCLGTHGQETTLLLNPSDERLIKQISQAIRVMSRHTVWESQCLVRAIAAKKMLERRRIESTLYLGTARDQSGKMIAHAWLRSGPLYITGAEEMKMFTAVAVFGTEIR